MGSISSRQTEHSGESNSKISRENSSSQSIWFCNSCGSGIIATYPHKGNLCNACRSQIMRSSALIKLRDKHLRRGDVEHYIKTPTGKIITVFISPTDTVLDLKKQISEHKGIPTQMQRLIFGKEMEDDKKCSDYNLQQDTTMHLT
eukprot:825211_1